jgi:hypothetical protein
LSVNGLESNTDYIAYFTAGNAHPGYPDLMSEKLTFDLNFKTLDLKEIPKLSLEFASIFMVNLLILLIIFN